MASFPRSAAGLAVLASLTATSPPAFASDLSPARDDTRRGCSCVGPQSGSVAGTIVSVNGDVTTLGVDGLNDAKTGANVLVGTRVTVGPDGGAALLFSRWCKVWLDSDSEADVSLDKKQLCVRVTKSQDIPEDVMALAGAGAAVGAVDGIGAGAAGLGAVALGAVGTISANGGGSKPASVSP